MECALPEEKRRSLKDLFNNVGSGILIFYLISGALAGLVAIIITWWFVQAKGTYERFLPNVEVYQYSSANLTVIIPEGIVLEPAQGPTITYFMNFAPVSNDSYIVQWNPCSSATAYLNWGNIVYCSSTQVTGSTGKNGMYFSAPSPIYFDAFHEFYKPWVIGYTFLWVYGAIPFVLFCCFVSWVTKK